MIMVLTPSMRNYPDNDSVSHNYHEVTQSMIVMPKDNITSQSQQNVNGNNNDSISLSLSLSLVTMR